MKKMLKPFKLISILMLFITTFIACDKDFSTIESDIEGLQNFTTHLENYPLTAFGKKLDPVQTNNLPSNLLGVYKDLTLDGITTANVVTQVVPTIFDPDFGTDPQLESVFLTIPYYVSTGETDEDGNATYSIDSLFGSAPIKLSIYQNNYFLRDIDPNDIEEAQNYYSNSNQTINFDNHVGELLFEYLIEPDDPGFIPSPEEHLIYEDDEETGEPVLVARITPGLRVELLNPDSFWENLLFAHEGMPELSNSNNFKDHFRGLYFKVENINNDGNMLMLNFGLAAANITVNYTYEDVDEDDLIIRTDAVYVMNFIGNRVNTLENNFNIPLIDGDSTNGDEKLFLKGGEGSISVIKFFNGDDIDDDFSTDNLFETFKKQYVEVDEEGHFIKSKRLINEVNLIFYVNQDDALGGEPDRIMVYDLKNNTPVVDYFFDSTTNNADPLHSKINHSTILERVDDVQTGDGIKYKIRLTEHFNNILLKDSTNVELGLTVSTNVNDLQNAKILDNEDVEIAVGSVLSPRGTVLFGSHQNVAEENRVQLEIYYTEPDN